MNKVILKGRLTNTPSQKWLTDKISVTRFNIAVNRVFKKDKEQEADFINCIAWNKQGEFVKKYFDKGQEIIIVGRLETSQYIDKESQKKITSYEVITEEIEFCGSKKTEKKEENQEEDFIFNENDIPTNISFDDDNDLPF